MRQIARLGALFLILWLLSACQPEARPIEQAAIPSPTRLPALPGASETALPTSGGEPTQAVEATLASPTLPPPLPATPAPGISALPDPASASWTRLVSGLAYPVGLANAGDGTRRLFVLEQNGVIRILEGGEILAEPFLDIRPAVICCGERGLLGIAFHPRYPENGYFYINYTEASLSGLRTVIARYQVSADPNIADPDSEVRLLVISQPYENHNGGGLQFGPDGYLYIGLGDGGSAGDPQGNGQSTGTLLGKLLRIDVDSGDPYAIPPDNPFSGGGGLPEIWAYGLRNPWRFAFDPLSGDLYIGDVGQSAWEEIDFLPADTPGGANFGWNYFEGQHAFEGTPPSGVSLISPVAEYPHGPERSVTGGEVYRGSALPQWNGVYLYGDYSSGKVWGLLRLPDGSWQNGLLFETDALITSFGVDEAGEVYLIDYNGIIWKLE